MNMIVSIESDVRDPKMQVVMPKENSRRQNSRILLMPWRWPKSAWMVIVPVLLIAYPLSAGPKCAIFFRYRNVIPSWLHDASAIPYQPLAIVREAYRPFDVAMGLYCARWVSFAEGEERAVKRRK